MSLSEVSRGEQLTIKFDYNPEFKAYYGDMEIPITSDDEFNFMHMELPEDDPAAAFLFTLMEMSVLG